MDPLTILPDQPFHILPGEAILPLTHSTELAILPFIHSTKSVFYHSSVRPNRPFYQTPIRPIHCIDRQVSMGETPRHDACMARSGLCISQLKSNKHFQFQFEFKGDMYEMLFR
jgi:hypothetical protein